MSRVPILNFDTLDPVAFPLPQTGETTLRDTVVPTLLLRLRASGARTWISSSSGVRRTLGNATLIPLDAARRMALVRPVGGKVVHRVFDADSTVRDVMPHFLNTGQNGRWKPSTLKMMRSVSAIYIIPKLGHLKLASLSPATVATWLLDVEATSTSARMALSTLAGLIRYAEDHGIRPPGKNPCAGLRKKERSHRGQLLPLTTIRKLWAALERMEGKIPDACDVIRLLIFTGARRSEVVGLEWDRIVDGRAVLEDSKTGPRTIWLNAPARDILRRRAQSAASPYVFPAPIKAGTMTSLDRSWRTLLVEAEIPALRIHDLRHHFASTGVSGGIDLHIVGNLLGHRDVESTLGYAHLARSAVSRAANRVSKRIAGAIGDCRTSSKDGHQANPAATTRMAIEVRNA